MFYVIGPSRISYYVLEIGQGLLYILFNYMLILNLVYQIYFYFEISSKEITGDKWNFPSQAQIFIPSLDN